MSSITKSRNPVSLPYPRWAALIALLAAQVLTISTRFDAEGIRADRPWSGLVAYSGSAVRLGFAVGLATLLVAGPGLVRELKRVASREGGSTWSRAALAGNLVAFLSFYWLSVPILEGDGPWHPADWALLVAWGIAGLATLVCWCMAALPADLWVVLLYRSGGSLVAGPALGAAAYMVGLLARDQWWTLSAATLQLVHGMLRLVFSNTIYQPVERVVGTPSFHVEVASACSGYEGMGLIAVLLSIALWMFRRDFRFPRALALLPLGITLMWLANAVRIASLVALGTLGYPELALGGFHSLAGWLLFLSIGLGLIACARRMPFFCTVPTDTASRRAVLDGAYLMPAMALIATAMVTATFSPGFDRYYPARVIAATVALVCYRRSYTELRLSWSWEAVAIGFGVFALWMVLEPHGATSSTGMPIRAGLESLPRGWATTWLIFRVVGSVLTVPLAEELAFRGYLTRRLMATDFQSVPPGRLTWWSLLISSVLFGALHGRWIAGTLAGLAYGLVYHRRGELTDAVVAHGVTNGLIAATVLITGAWSLWG